jgi:hypothetical protein
MYKTLAITVFQVLFAIITFCVMIEVGSHFLDDVMSLSESWEVLTTF